MPIQCFRCAIEVYYKVQFRGCILNPGNDPPGITGLATAFGYCTLH